MRIAKLTTIGFAFSLASSLAGCQSDNSKKPTVNVPTQEMNDRTADSRVRDAEAAERDGNYQRAIEIYERLRSYPEASRPGDLEARIRRLSDKMKKSAAQ